MKINNTNDQSELFNIDHEDKIRIIKNLLMTLEDDCELMDVIDTIRFNMNDCYEETQDETYKKVASLLSKINDTLDQ